MQSHFSVFRAHQMIDDVGSRGTSPAIAKPLLTDVAHYDGAWLVDPTILTGVGWQLLVV